MFEQSAAIGVFLCSDHYGSSGGINNYWIELMVAHDGPSGSRRVVRAARGEAVSVGRREGGAREGEWAERRTSGDMVLEPAQPHT